LVRAPFLNHCALNNDERATSSRLPFTNASWRVRGRLTLMLAVLLTQPYASTGTPSLVYERHSRRAFRYPAHAADIAGYRMFFVPSIRSGWRMILGAGSGGDTTSSLRSSRGRTVVALPVRLFSFGGRFATAGTRHH